MQQLPRLDGQGGELLNSNLLPQLELNREVGRLDSYRDPKFPQFFRSNPQLGFGQVEASFRNCRISARKTMVDTIIAAEGRPVARGLAQSIRSIRRLGNGALLAIITN